MKDLKLQLFEFGKSLNIEQSDVKAIVDSHVQAYDEMSEIQIFESLKEKLDVYRYDSSINKLLENISVEIGKDELRFQLKDLYKRVESLNGGQIFRHPMVVIRDIINEDDEVQMKARILNELSVYDFVNPIKVFLHNFSNNPLEKENLNSRGGNAEKVYTIVEQVEGGHIAFLNDKWFYISESDIQVTTPDAWFSETEDLKRLVQLQKVCQVSEMNESEIQFDIDENLVLGIDTDNGRISLNGELVEEDTTLESIFNSPIVPYLKKNQYYTLIKEAQENINKFVELDLALKVSNIANPFTESYVFNYKDNIYAYTVDKRYGNSFYKYESAVEIVNEMQNELGFDLTYFYEDKFNEEVIGKKKLEEREKIVLEKLEEVNFNIDRLDSSGKMHLDTIATAKEELVKERNNLEQEIRAIGRLRSEWDKELV